LTHDVLAPKKTSKHFEGLIVRGSEFASGQPARQLLRLDSHSMGVDSLALAGHLTRPRKKVERIACIDQRPAKMRAVRAARIDVDQD
jgi:hypothetical protein